MKYFNFFILLFISCSGNCDSINKNFSSYDESISIIRSSDFIIEENIDTNSSWINSIEYYSCDEATGYLIVNTKKGESYLHENVPIQVWN